ncbi:prepilin-type N-terminal cleavage/methylation domain-containing protein [Halobacillus locisalis]|uniref:Prepilin-type N-terminal cleavage/methylation domain-containing protein n=1 Tax=Halobacillus locisalis TaxID=220753 RepID=A0A838CTT4_9BACI|nr:prepilin-type N-terminal cleavage/methylation domain-containing protein [Halobacillus locisalis]MBA2175354.1 prepilin-type N-terminal cleavage/methylation domain-containing protein [Halobacillus locisalis]
MIKSTNEKGFTLLEVLSVLVIVAIIYSIAVPVVSGVIEIAREGP